MNMDFTAEIYNEALIMIEDFFYNMGDLLTYMQSNIPELTIEQKGIYDQIMQTVVNGVGGIFFLDVLGGTGKTFLIRLILATI